MASRSMRLVLAVAYAAAVSTAGIWTLPKPLVPPVLLIALGLPLVFRLVPRNYIYGMRSPRTLWTNDDTWYRPNVITGIAMVLIGIVWLAIVAFTATVSAQSADPSFDVVSVKPSTAAERGGGSSGLQPGGRYVMTNGPTEVMLKMAYRTPTGEILGAPDWVRYEHYDVDARAGHDIALDDLAPRLRTLLADRFKLKAHLETRVRPMYELRVASLDGTLGPDMHRSALDCEARRGTCSTRGDTGVIESNGISMTSFASWLPARIGRPVFDRTNLSGYYELRLTYSPAPGGIDRIRPTDSADAAPALPTALREQLGLRLDAIDAPTEVLVIDHIERPSNN